MTDAEIDRIRSLRRKGFSLYGIAKHTGLPEADVAKVIGEAHLLGQISSAVGKQRRAGG